MIMNACKKANSKTIKQFKALKGMPYIYEKISDNNCQKVCEQKMMSLEEDIQFLERPILNNRN